MKITFIKPIVTQNGGSRVVAIYAEKLLAMGHDVTVVSRFPERKSFSRRTLDFLKGSAAQPSDPNRTVYYDGLGDRHIQVPWTESLNANDVPDADVVIATWWRTAFEVAAFPPEKGAKAYFVQGHEVYGTLPRDLSRGSYFLPLAKITIAQWLVDVMSKNYDDQDVTLVPNSVDTRLFFAAERNKHKVPTIGLIYSDQALKNTALGLRAVDEVRKKFPDLKLVAFGTCNPTQELPLPRYATYHKLPAQSDLPRIYASCDAWVMSSDSEGYGLPILEAMACRTPVVSTRTGAGPDLITDGAEGFVVDIGDQTALADRLAKIIGLDNAAWRKMSEAAHSKAHGYSWDDAATKFEAALQQIVMAK